MGETIIEKIIRHNTGKKCQTGRYRHSQCRPGHDP